MGDVKKCVITPFHTQYGKPEKDDPQAFLASFIDLFSGYSDSLLEAAARRVIIRRKYSTWPMPGDLTEAIEQVQAERARYAKQRRPELPDPQRHDWRENPVELRVGLFMNVEGQRLANGMRTICHFEWSGHFLDLPLVRQAEEEGWGRELRSHVRQILTQQVLDGKQFTRPQDYMPTDQHWIDETRALAKIFRAAEAHRAQAATANFESVEDLVKNMTGVA